LLQAIVYDTLRHMSWLDHIRKELRPRKLEEKMRWLVLMGLCQLFVLRQAEHAAVSETVRLAPQRARGVVNGMLRNAVRRKTEFDAGREKLPLAVQFSTPSWLVNRWIREFGEPDTRAMLEWNSQTPPVYGRINPVNPPAEIPENWEPLKDLPLWYRLKGALPLDLLKSGSVYVTDPSTRYCVQLLAPQPGERVLDACAAPGTKSQQIACAMENEGEIVACELHEHRTGLIDRLMERSGVRICSAVCTDSSKPDQFEGESFDRILIDAPCSGLGDLSHKPEIRWHLQPQDIDDIVALQEAILEANAPYLKKGGLLVYSTCTLNRKENSSRIQAFLKKHPEFELRQEKTMFPFEDRADGFYAAALLKRN
jgi:16S rRNA (cytosine967-C5)-methyltransferase